MASGYKDGESLQEDGGDMETRGHEEQVVAADGNAECAPGRDPSCEAPLNRVVQRSRPMSGAARRNHGSRVKEEGEAQGSRLLVDQNTHKREISGATGHSEDLEVNEQQKFWSEGREGSASDTSDSTDNCTSNHAS